MSVLWVGVVFVRDPFLSTASLESGVGNKRTALNQPCLEATSYQGGRSWGGTELLVWVVARDLQVWKSA